MPKVSAEHGHNVLFTDFRPLRHVVSVFEFKLDDIFVNDKFLILKSELKYFIVMQAVITEYQRFFTEQSEKHPQEGDLLGNFFGPPGIPNRAFFYHLFHTNEDAFFEFLVDSSLLSSSMKCVCGNDMKIIKNKQLRDGRIWYCGKAGLSRCKREKSVRHSSIFTGSKLRKATILMLCYELFQGSSENSLRKDLGVFTHCISDWRQCITEVLLNFIETNTEKVGGHGKVVEVIEAKMWRKKITRGNFYAGQKVFGGIELGSGRIFLVAVFDTSAETLISLIEQWIEPETEIVSKCWDPVNRLGEEGCNHLMTKHSLHFLNYASDASTIDAEETLRNSKSNFPLQGSFEFNIVWFMFGRLCSSLKLDPFVKFLDLVRQINWTDWHASSTGEDEELKEE